MSFTVDLECALTAEDGRILLGGDTTDPTFDETPTGTRTAIVLKPGSPVSALFAWQASRCGCLGLRAPRKRWISRPAVYVTRCRPTDARVGARRMSVSLAVPRARRAGGARSRARPAR